MLIERGQTIVGFDAIELRTRLRGLLAPRSVDAFAEHTSSTITEAAERLRRMYNAGLAQVVSIGEIRGYSMVDEPRDTPMWTTTVDGNAI